MRVWMLRNLIITGFSGFPALAYPNGWVAWEIHPVMGMMTAPMDQLVRFGPGATASFPIVGRKKRSDFSDGAKLLR